jgi:hypothetical protein
MQHVRRIHVQELSNARRSQPVPSPQRRLQRPAQERRAGAWPSKNEQKRGLCRIHAHDQSAPPTTDESARSTLSMFVLLVALFVRMVVADGCACD